MQNHDKTIRIPSFVGTAGPLVLTLLLPLLPMGCGGSNKENPPPTERSAPDARPATTPETQPGPEAGRETAGPPTDKQSCETSASAGICDPGTPAAEITRAAGGPLLAKVTVTSGGCRASECSTGCESISVYGGSAQIGGPCQLTVTAVDGRTQSVQLSVAQNPSPVYACCDVLGRSAWVALDPEIMSPARVSVSFEGTDAGFHFSDGGSDGGSLEPPSFDAGATGIGFDSNFVLDGNVSVPDVPTPEQVCLATTGVTPCDPGTAHTTVSSATGEPYLTKVEVTNGLCTGSICPAGCNSLVVSGSIAQDPGETCDILVTLTDGSARSFHLNVAANRSASYTCCGYPLPPHNGIWTTLNPVVLEYPVMVMPPGWDGGAITVDAASTTQPVTWDGGVAPGDTPAPRF